MALICERDYHCTINTVKKCKVEQYIAKMTVELDFFGGRQPK